MRNQVLVFLATPDAETPIPRHKVLMSLLWLQPATAAPSSGVLSRVRACTVPRISVRVSETGRDVLAVVRGSKRHDCTHLQQ